MYIFIYSNYKICIRLLRKNILIGKFNMLINQAYKMQQKSVPTYIVIGTIVSNVYIYIILNLRS